MGEEHSYMDTLSLLAGGKPSPPLAMPPHGFGAGTINKNGLRCTIWLLQQRSTVALERCLEFFRGSREAGHCALGNKPPEPLTPTHIQLYFALWAGCLWGARLVRSEELQELVESVWQVETAADLACLSNLGVRTPGARALKDGQPMLVNSTRDKVVPALAAGWVRPPRAARQGSYDAAIPLLSRAFAAGARPEALVSRDFSPLTARYGFTVDRDGEDYWACFDARLGNVLEPVYGVGVIGGELSLRADLESAQRVRERFAV